jgi:putative acetyltransferase
MPPTQDSTESLVVRAARPSDAEEIAAIHNLPGYRFGTLRIPYTSPEAVRKWLESQPPTNVNIVAVLDGSMVGTAGLERYAGRRSHVASLGMGVHDDFVGRGVGSALLRALIDTAEQWLAVRRLELAVYSDNARAIRLYERHGFDVEGTLRAYAFRDGTYVDALAMARFCKS